MMARYAMEHWHITKDTGGIDDDTISARCQFDTLEEDQAAHTEQRWSGLLLVWIGS
jgi:hypothetical protein